MDIAVVAADLRREQEALDALAADLTDEQWATATPSPGWTVADQIGHLTYFDGTAALAIDGAAAFERSLEELVAAGDGRESMTLLRDLGPTELLAAWRTNRGLLHERAARLAVGDRVPWYGPSMGAASFLTARLMETWAHGQDVVDAVGGERPATDRLRHIAQLGFITRGWTYANRGLEAPVADVQLELDGPNGDAWHFGADGAADLVRGSALDFCLVVTQRRHVDDTDLEITGEGARDWLAKAQVFAGPPTDGPRPRRA